MAPLILSLPISCNGPLVPDLPPSPGAEGNEGDRRWKFRLQGRGAGRATDICGRKLSMVT